MTKHGQVYVAFQVERDTDDHRPHVELIEQIIEQALTEHGYAVRDRPALRLVDDDDVSTDR